MKMQPIFCMLLLICSCTIMHCEECTKLEEDSTFTWPIPTDEKRKQKQIDTCKRQCEKGFFPYTQGSMTYDGVETGSVCKKELVGKWKTCPSETYCCCKPKTDAPAKAETDAPAEFPAAEGAVWCICNNDCDAAGTSSISDWTSNNCKDACAQHGGWTGGSKNAKWNQPSPICE